MSAHRLGTSLGFFVALTTTVAVGLPAWGAVSQVQQSSGSGTGTLAVAWPTPTTAGNLLVATVSCLGGSGTTITPPAGWTAVQRVDNGTTIGAAIYSVSNAASQSGLSIWTCSGLKNGTLSLAEYSGLATASALDVVGAGTGSGSSPATATVVTTSPGDLAISVFANNSSATASSYSGSFTGMNQPADPFGSITAATAQAILGTSGPLASGATLGGAATWAAALATFKAAGAASRYWIGSTSGYFDDDTRWSSISGGGNDVGAPSGTGQTAIFDGNGSGDCTLRGDPNLAGIQMLNTPGAGYAGSVRAASGTSGSLVGAGLTGDWYTGQNFNAYVTTVLDATVDYPDLTATALARVATSTNFTVRYMGQVKASYSETYTFYTQSDDGVRLWVNGQLVVDNWTPHSTTENSGTIALSANTWYDVKLEYQQLGGLTVLQLKYQSPSEAKKVIPSTNLRSTGNLTYYQGLSADWYAGTAFNTYQSNARDTSVDFADTTAIGTARAGVSSGYSARWSGQVLATYSETYTFYTQSDDGVRLYVNGNLVIDHWNDHSTIEDSASVALAAGQWYDIKLEYYNNAGAGTMQLSFASPSEAKKIIPVTSLRTSLPLYGTSGLSGDWWAGVGYDTYLSTFADSTINYSDVTATALSRIYRSEYYAVRWTGQILVPYSETYTFYTQSDDGVRLYVNGTLVVNNWSNHGTLENSGTIALTAGQWYDIKLEYYNASNQSVIQLKYQSPSLAKQILPSSNLRRSTTESPILTLGAGGLDQRAGVFVGGTRDVTVAGSVALSGGTFQTTSGLLSIGGTFNKTGGAFSGGVGRMLMTSASNQTFTSGGAALHDLYFNDGLVGYWKLDETGGNVLSDSSGFGGTGQEAQFPSFPQTGQPPLNFTDPVSMSFTGTGQGVTVPHNARLAFTAAQSYTLSAWVNATNLSSASVQAVVVKARNTSNYYGIYMSASPSPRWMAGAGSSNVTGSVVTTGWHHVAVVQDGPNNRRDIYVDGTSAGTGLAADGSGVGDLWIARSSAGETFTGGIDDVRVYNRPLSAAELRALSLGNQPSTGVSTATLAGSLKVSGSLSLMSGTLAGAQTVSVGGSWLNSGGIYTNTGAVTFNGLATGYFIQSGGQSFPSLTVNGSGGGWTLGDRLWVPGAAVTLTAGTLNGGTWTARVGTLTPSGGTFTPATGTMILDSRSSQTISIGSFGGLRLEDTSETGLVAYWKIDRGTGTRFDDHSGSGNAGTLSAGSMWTTSVPTTAYDDPAAVSFNGSTFGSMGATNLPAANATQTISAWAKFSSSAASQAIVALTRAGSSSGVVLGLGGGNVRVYKYGGADMVTKAAPIDGQWHHLAYTYDGATERLYVDGGTPATATGVTHQTATPDASWLGTSSGGSDLLNGQVDDVRVYAAALTASQVAALAAGRYAGTGGLATMTFGTNVAVSGTFAIDNDNLTTSTRTLTASSAASPAMLSTGTYTVGSAAQTLSGGLTVQPDGTVTMASSGGTLTMGATKTFTMGGTLNASVASGTLPRIDCAGCTAGLGITIAFGATSTLNLNGLELDYSVGTGVSIASGATLTQLKRLQFQNNVGGAASTHLALTLGSGVVIAPGCYFDATAAHNVTLYGAMASPAGARAIFENQSGAVNGAGAGPSLDQDGDSNGDNVGDNVSTGPYYGSVVQWVNANPTDTSGSAVGFPTAAFDWNTFSYYGVYASFKDTTGAGTADVLWKRNDDGSPAYSFSVPQASGDLLGAPYWDTVNEATAGFDINGNGNHTDTDVRIVYLATSLGHVIKLVDTGAALVRPTSGPWSSDFTSASVATISSPVTKDATNLYFGGTDGTAAPNVFGVQVAGGANEKTLQKTVSSLGLVTTTPTWSSYSGSTYVFVGSAASAGQAYAYRMNMGSKLVDGSFTGSASTFNGAAVLVNNRAYLVTDGGALHVLDAFNFGVGGFTNLSGFPYQSAAAKPIKSAPWIDSATGTAYFGDDGGNLYAVASSGANQTGYPLSISSGITLPSSPIYRRGGGVIGIGGSDGYVYFVDRRNGSGVPSIFKRFFVTAAGSISNVSYDANISSYMVSSSDGKLVFVNAADVVDPTPGTE